MALGDIVTVGDKASIEILASRTTTNSPPTQSDATVGVSCDALKAAFGGKIPDALTLQIVSTAGSATMTCTATIWTYAGGKWGRPGVGATSSVKGLINEGNTIDEVTADIICHFEEITWLAHFERVYLEITAIAGTATAVKGLLLGGIRYGSY